ncbi:MAG: amino acid--[acyl-carrier-protein] ligase [Steroidobacteraceae bacterium]
MAKIYDIDQFYQDLVSHGLIIPVGVQGAFGRGKVFESIVEAFNAMISRISAADGAEEMWFPPVINRKIIERVHYLESFPHLCGAVHSFFGTELESKKLAEMANAGEDWGSMLKMTDVALSPAVCYPVYPTCSGSVPVNGRLITITNWVFRHEPSPEPTRLQSFRMREFIRIGTADQVVEWRGAWLQKGISILRSLGLQAQSDVASDPFFGRGGKVLGRSQREQRLKFEVLVPVISLENPTAVCSFNFHQEHFGGTFDIRTADGNVANTACLGFGLERVTMALLKEHGFDPGKWPSAVQNLLWPR